MKVRLLAAALLSVLLVSCGGTTRRSTGTAANTPATGNAFLYVSNASANTISAFIIDNASGALTPASGSPFPAGGNTPGRAALDSGNRFLFVINRGSGSVSSYAINSSNGVLTPGSSVATGAGSLDLVVHPSASFLYVLNANTIFGFSFDSNGFFTTLPNFPVALTAPATGSMSIGGNGTFLFVTTTAGVTVFQIASNGSLTLLNSPAPVGGTLPTFIADDPAATSLLFTISGSQLFGWSFTSGVGVNAGFTPLPQTPAPTVSNGTWISFVPAGTFAYVGGGSSASGEIDGYSLASNGAPTLVTGSPFATSSAPAQMVVDPSGKFLYSANAGTNVTGYTITAGTGVLIAIPGSPFSVSTPGGIALARF